MEWQSGAIDIEVYIDPPGSVSFYAEQSGTDEMVNAALAGNDSVVGAWINRSSVEMVSAWTGRSVLDAPR